MVEEKKLKTEEKKKSEPTKKKKNDDEPSWYHYAIVLLVIFVVIFGIHFLVNINSGISTDDYQSIPDASHIYENSNTNQPYVLVNETTNETHVILPVNLSKKYVYKKEIDGQKFNLEFVSPVPEVANYGAEIQISKIEILNSHSLTLSFLEYNGLDNMYVSTASVKLMRLFKYLYKLNFERSNFRMFKDINCANSTIDDKVIVFDPYQNTTGIYYNNTNGCIEIYGRSPSDLVRVTDKLIFNLVNEE